MWTIPNAISLIRILLIPAALAALDRHPLTASIILAVIGASDWIDGWIARRFSQESELGRVLDPLADRLVVIIVGTALVVLGDFPLILGILILAREVFIVLGAWVVYMWGATRVRVIWVGKAGTLCIFFSMPAFLAGYHTFFGEVTVILGWVGGILGLLLSYLAAARYVPLAIQSLSQGKQDRARGTNPSRDLERSGDRAAEDIRNDADSATGGEQ